MAIAALPQAYTFSVYNFTSKEIDQIVTLVVEWTGGRVLPIDQRRHTKNVLEYAERWLLLDIRVDGRLVPGEGHFQACYDLPTEALWRIVSPMFDGQRSRGHSIARRSEWLTLNIWPVGNKRASAASLQEQIDVLDRLASQGYLLVQMAGSVWEITCMQG